MMPTDTLPRLLRRNAASMGASPAMREKRHGIWQTLSWAAYERLVLDFASGLAERGFGAGDRLAVLGDNRPRLYAAMLAAQSLGGIGVPLWPDADPTAIAATLADACVRIAVAEDQEQVAKLRTARASLPDLAWVVSLDPRALHGDDQAWLVGFDELCQQGAATDGAKASTVDGKADDVALLLPRSGQPAVMLRHANLVAAARAIADVEDVRPADQTLCFLPMAWIGDALYSLALGLSAGLACNCPESPETASRDLREIGPHVLAAPPAIWEAWLRSAEDRAAHATGLKHAAFRWARRIAETAEHRREAGAARGPGERVLHAIADRLVLAPMRDQLGLSRLRWAHTGGMPAASEIWRLYRAFGVNLKQSYGPAELAGLATMHRTDPVAAETVGLPAPGTQIRIADDGEVQARGDTVCAGYDANTETTQARLTGDGWWRTGDAGAIDSSGRLAIHGRLDEIALLQDGTRFIPDAVEAHLRRSRYIADALAFAAGGSFVAAIIAPQRAALGEWAEANRVPGSSLAALTALPETRALIRDELRRCNAGLPPSLHVRRFLLLDHPLEAEDIEARLYRARFRHAALQRHATLVEALLRDPARGTEVPEQSAAAHTQAIVEDVEGPMLPRLEPAHA